MNVGQLFDPEPAQWGLRGDPYLWRELKMVFVDIPPPDTSEKLKNLLEAAFESAAGHPISHPKFIYIKRFDHGGMSSGMISPEFWRERGIPLLVSRYPSKR